MNHFDISGECALTGWIPGTACVLWGDLRRFFAAGLNQTKQHGVAVKEKAAR